MNRCETIQGIPTIGKECLSATTTLSLELNILGDPVCFDINVTDMPARLSDITPLARTLSSKLAMAMRDRLGTSDECVPCRKGCSMCCSYLVPLSVPEAFRLAEELPAMPASEGTPLIQASIETARTILERMPVDFDMGGSADTNDDIQSKQLGDWYAGLGLSCPFLSDGLCITYEQRPVACREHMVTGFPDPCDPTSPEIANLVKMPVSVLECLGRLTAELEQSEVEAIMLPLALPWAQENIERSKRTWPAVTVVERFIEILRTSSETAAPEAVAVQSSCR